MDSLSTLQDLVSAYGPPGQEDEVRAVLQEKLARLRLHGLTDPKGNLIVGDGPTRPQIVVTAHMDEIALMVKSVRSDGTLLVTNLGGIFPWKVGEGPVAILSRKGPIPGVLGVGSIHTESDASHAKIAKSAALTWSMCSVFTGKSYGELEALGVRPGTRVVLEKSRRTLTDLGDHISGYFLDDRADLVSWLIALGELKDSMSKTSFVATTSEEVGGEGALYYLTKSQPDFCIALELGPNVPDAPVALTDAVTVWTGDAYAATPPFLFEIIERSAEEADVDLQFQLLSRGGSDASCSAGKGLCAHPITLGLAMDNSHGYEIIHKQAMHSLGRLTACLVRRLEAL